MRILPLSLSVLLVGWLLVRPAASQSFPDPPEIDLDSLATAVVEDGEDDPLVTDFILGARPGLEFAPSATALLAGNLSASEKGTVTTVSSSPFRITDVRPLWGVSLSASNDAASARTTLGVGYTARWRWILEDCQVRAAEQAAEDAYARTLTPDQQRDPDARARLLLEELDAEPISLVPVPSLSYYASAFAPNSTVTDQETFAGHVLKGSLEWQYGSRLIAAATGSIGTTRAEDVADTPLVGKRTASLTVTTVVPQLLGTRRYDDYYLENQFQRGIGLGFTISYSACAEPDDSREDCPEGLLSDTLIGAVVDLRVTSSLAPRFIIGRRSFERFQQGDDATDATLQFGLQLALAISKGS